MGRLGCSSARFFQAGHCVAALLHSAAGALRGDPCSCQKAKAKRDVFVVSLVEAFFFQVFSGFQWFQGPWIVVSAFKCHLFSTCFVCFSVVSV